MRECHVTTNEILRVQGGMSCKCLVEDRRGEVTGKELRWEDHTIHKTWGRCLSPGT